MLADLGRAEHALDVAQVVLSFDLEAEVAFPALPASSFVLVVFVILWRDSQWNVV